VNAAEPVKKTNFARTKLPSSTGWMTQVRRQLPVRVPTAVSSRGEKIHSRRSGFLRGGTEFGAEEGRRRRRYDSLGVPGMGIESRVREATRWRRTRISCTTRPPTT